MPVRCRSGRVIEGVENTRLAGWAGHKPRRAAHHLQTAGANVIETVDRIKAVLPQLEKLDSAVDQILRAQRPHDDHRASVNDVQFSLMLSIALVVMVIFLFLRRFWPTFIASITVPLALAGTFARHVLLDYSIDNLSLMAITISVGFVVDDAIVVIENIFRFIEQGETADARRRSRARGRSASRSFR